MKDIEKMLINSITKMNARQLSHSYINLVVSVLFHLFEMNDVVLNKRKIKKFIGEYRKMNKDRGYDHREIKMLVDAGRGFPITGLSVFCFTTPQALESEV